MDYANKALQEFITYFNQVKQDLLINARMVGSNACQVTVHNQYKENQGVLLGKKFCDVLNLLEKEPVQFSEQKEITETQKNKFASYLKISAEVEKYLGNELIPQSTRIREQLSQLLRCEAGLRYRIESIHDGISRKEIPHLGLFSDLKLAAEKWKAKQTLYVGDYKALTADDISKIKEVCRYRYYADLLLADKKLQDSFFKWVIRDNNGIRQFIEFPATMARMSAVFLDKRVGRFGCSETRDELTVQMQPSETHRGMQEKVICLPFYDGEKTQRISILDEKREVVLNGNRHISIKEIFNIFSKKNSDAGTVEYFGVNGIMNWSNYELGWWSDQAKSCVKMNLNNQWWEQLPKLEVISRNAAEKRYQIKIEAGQWVKVLASTQSELRYHLKGCHGYLEVLIPLNDDQYAVYSFGEFPKKFPNGNIKTLAFLPKTVPASISYPDENIAFSNRLHAYHAEAISSSKGEQFMEKIKYAIENGRKDNLAFQISGKNCAYWAEETYAAECKDMFKVPAAEMKPSDWSTWVLLVIPAFCFLRLLSRCAKKGAMQITDQHGQTVIEATAYGKSYKDTYRYHPVFFANKIRAEEISGVLPYGNSDILRPRFKS